ncbi:molybdopterin-guanine dinucleotide biosynthesis protein B [Orbaceae bacterium ac157xtp]
MKILGICGYSGSGKTTLLNKLIPALKKQGIRFGVIKHTHHNLDIDTKGKDSYSFRQSGAEQVIVACDDRWALMTETPSKTINLKELVSKFTDVDLVLVEGFKDEPIAKIVCHRKENQKPPFYDEHTIAMATDQDLDIAITQILINDTNEIIELIKHFLQSEYKNMQIG